MDIEKYKIAIICGSANTNGNTQQISSTISKQLDIKIYTLSDYNISYYDYQNNNKTDDFIPLLKDLTKNYQTYIFITPVYWYAMSAIMKTFFDRITDLLTIEKNIGRKLRRKKVIFITTSIGDNLGNDFWIPIKATLDYLDMELVYTLHCIDNVLTDIHLKALIEKMKLI